MPSNIDQPSLLPKEAQMPLNFSGILELLRQEKNNVLAVQLVDALSQIYLMFGIIWKTLKFQLPEINSIELLGTDGNAIISINPEAITVQSPTDATKLLLLDFNTVLIAEGSSSQALLEAGGGVGYLRLTGAFGAIDISVSAAAATLDMPTGGRIVIGGNQVLTNRQATVTSVSGTAGATYTATEQGMINNLKTAVNDIISRLQGMGIIA